MILIKVIVGVDEDFIVCYCLYWGYWMIIVMLNRFLKVNEVYLEFLILEKIFGFMYYCNFCLGFYY